MSCAVNHVQQRFVVFFLVNHEKLQVVNYVVDHVKYQLVDNSQPSLVDLPLFFSLSPPQFLIIYIGGNSLCVGVVISSNKVND